MDNRGLSWAGSPRKQHLVGWELKGERELEKTLLNKCS